MPGMDLGIDLGTSQVVIYASGKGVVLKEPAVIAVDSRDGHIVACGQEAYDMLGRTPDSITAVRPLAKGVIADYDYAERMLRYFVRKVCAYKILKPRAAVSVPASVTEVEQRSVVEAVSAAGVRRVVLIEEAVAAAIGAGLDVSAARGSMAVNIGGGTTDVACCPSRASPRPAPCGWAATTWTPPLSAICVPNIILSSAPAWLKASKNPSDPPCRRRLPL